MRKSGTGIQEGALGRAEQASETRRFSVVEGLQRIQEERGYLPREDLEELASRTGIPLARFYGVATFYNQFSLEPKGKHVVTVCTGTACHVRGASGVLDSVQEMLLIGPGETTADMDFTLETVNCLGACALGPLVSVDGKYYGKMSRSRIQAVMEAYGVHRDAAED